MRDAIMLCGTSRNQSVETEIREGLYQMYDYYELYGQLCYDSACFLE